MEGYASPHNITCKKLGIKKLKSLAIPLAFLSFFFFFFKQTAQCIMLDGPTTKSKGNFILILGGL